MASVGMSGVEVTRLRLLASLTSGWIACSAGATDSM